MLALPKLQPTLVVGFNFARPHRDENRRFDTIVDENKPCAVRVLRVVSNANNPVGDNYENLKKLKFTKFF